ncbi:Glyoxalase/Bleomycin resistance protein/Dihydroxybiphenyl dioxygenase [Pleomassaria siparia CBS 279.74]|uniref:Glyoxalase/Bleomycin resistance protein/Dihydroxybiphenyl dioxygenase n=1 Tax=Pleomassaria siparia CBS 279.74 TaxID=1314801 RepID=A0A6G1KLA1_9PLEO|nr:Glyoxalase/Bleomycin resistance protein/Dihydroxybiphenyl dioxygenase [Pleomassaria siparia CBS 279.74]
MGATIPTLESLSDKPVVTSPSTLAHIVLQTTQVAIMADFYCTFLGGHVVFDAPFGTFITYDEEHHRIALISLPSTIPRVPEASGLQHIAFAFPTLTALLTAYQQRLKHGIEPHFCVNHGPSTSMYYKDPDGNMIETQVDNLDTAEEATRYMQSEAFAKNPIGVAFKPDELIEKLRAGASEKDVLGRDDGQSWGVMKTEDLEGIF